MFCFNGAAPTYIYPLSLHDTLPICGMLRAVSQASDSSSPGEMLQRVNEALFPSIPANMFVTCFYAILDPKRGSLSYANADRKSTRLNSSHANISYAVFCLKKIMTQY